MDMEIRKEGAGPEDYKLALEKSRDFITKNDMKWPEASEESIRDITQNRFLVHSYPTLVLMDPKGEILALGHDVMGEKLDKILEKLLPEKLTR